MFQAITNPIDRTDQVFMPGLVHLRANAANVQVYAALIPGILGPPNPI